MRSRKTFFLRTIRLLSKSPKFEVERQHSGKSHYLCVYLPEGQVVVTPRL